MCIVSIIFLMKHIARIFVKCELDNDFCVSLPDWHNTHLLSVLRISLGDKIIVFSEKIGEWQAEICHISKKEIIAKCIQKIRDSKIHDKLYLAFGIIKPDNVRLIIEKGTELGVTDFFPIITEFTNQRLQNIEKLSKIAIFASEQSERITIPRLHEATKLHDFLTTCDVKIYAAIERFLCNKYSNFEKDCCFLIGPEGGFSNDEISILQKHTTPITLSSNILRSETAAISILSVFNYSKI